MSHLPKGQLPARLLHWSIKKLRSLRNTMNLKKIISTFAICGVSGVLGLGTVLALHLFGDQSPPHAIARITVIETIEAQAGCDWSIAKLRVHNDGTRRMVVRLRDAECGCTGKSKAAKIPVWESKDIEMEVYTKSILGKSHLDLLVTTTDPQQLKIPVRFPVVTLPSTDGAVSVLELN